MYWEQKCDIFKENDQGHGANVRTESMYKPYVTNQITIATNQVTIATNQITIGTNQMTIATRHSHRHSPRGAKGLSLVTVKAKVIILFQAERQQVII